MTQLASTVMNYFQDLVQKKCGLDVKIVWNGLTMDAQDFQDVLKTLHATFANKISLYYFSFFYVLMSNNTKINVTSLKNIYIIYYII